MTEILLIPGYATDCSSLFRPARGNDGGFGAFADDVALGRATVFRWGIPEHVSAYRLSNPFTFVDLYDREHLLAEERVTADKLEYLFEQQQPRIVICHSLGCLVLANFLKFHSLPPSVQQIVFIQADISAREEVAVTIPLFNLYCPWDPTLIFSSLYHRRLRAGLIGLRHAKNKLFALRLPINLHTSSIRDKRLRRFIFSDV